MEIQAFGYLGVGASNLDDWAAFATSNVGMQAVDRASSMRAFRMDDRKQRLFIDRAIERGLKFSAGKLPTPRLSTRSLPASKPPASP